MEESRDASDSPSVRLTPLKVVVAVLFFIGGTFAIVAGAATWHSEASRPRAIARAVSQFNCVTDADTGTACDERIVFSHGDHQIHTVVRSIDPPRDLYGPPGKQHLVIFFDPADPSHVEEVNGVAVQGVALILGGVAAILAVAIYGVRIARIKTAPR